jgi:acetylornithine deacetylase/succinyl-diaminopimelate desuccinylase-like protein
MISQLKTADGTIHIPELQAAIPEPTALEKKFYEDDPLNIEQALCSEMGISKLIGENDFPALERLGVRPTLEVHGIVGGFTAEGAKTVIPAEATAKISLRVPANLDPNKVFVWLEKRVKQLIPEGYTVTISNIHAGSGVNVAQDNRFFQEALLSLEKTFTSPPVLLKEGGSIPVAALFDQELKSPVVLMGFALPDDNIHAPNEKFNLQQFLSGMKTVADYLGRLKI